MLITPEILGKRIKYFRKRSKVSQLELESAIDTSAGAVSRMEAGTVNPTKETIIKIAKYLKLNSREVDYLIGVTAEPATNEEIEEAKKEVAEYFQKKGLFAYLIDDRWRLCAITKAFQKSLGMDDKYLKKYMLTPTIEFITNPDMKFLDRFSPDTYEDSLKNALIFYYKEVGYMFDDEVFLNSVSAIRKNKLARYYWDEIVKVHSKGYPLKEGRYVNFRLLNKFDFKLSYTYEPLLNSSRFILVEYKADNKFIEFISKFLY